MKEGRGEEKGTGKPEQRGREGTLQRDWGRQGNGEEVRMRIGECETGRKRERGHHLAYGVSLPNLIESDKR